MGENRSSEKKRQSLCNTELLETNELSLEEADGEDNDEK